jgi:hypothetical protein
MKFASQTSIKGLVVVVVALAAGAILAEKHLAASVPPPASHRVDSRPRVGLCIRAASPLLSDLKPTPRLRFEEADLFIKSPDICQYASTSAIT